MLRKAFCSLVMLGLLVAVVAAQGPPVVKADKPYPAMIVKVDDAKHLVMIKYPGPHGKIIEKTFPVLNTVKLGDIKPGTKYLIVPKGGKIIAFRPAPAAPPAKKVAAKPIKPPAVKPIKTVAVKPIQKPVPVAKAPVVLTKAEQEKIAAAQVVKVKTEAVKTAQAKVVAAQKKVAGLEKQVTAANQFVKATGNAAEAAAVRVARANMLAARAEAQAQVAMAKAALARAEAVKAQAFAKVQIAQANLAKVEAGIVGQEKAFAVKFMNARTAALKAAKAQFNQAKVFANKAIQELRAAQQVEKQKVTAAKKTVAIKNVKKDPKH
jgi:hypothetical protein